MFRSHGSILGLTRSIMALLACLLVSKASAFSNGIASNASRIIRINGGSNKRSRLVDISSHPSGSSLQPTVRIPHFLGNSCTSTRHMSNFCQSQTWLRLGSFEEGDDTDGSSSSDLDKFRSLMGSLYGVAGLAHAGDCYFGESKLLVAAGSSPYSDLPLEGQVLVAIWCAAGPLAFLASRNSSRIADWGLLFYGGVEVLGAAIIKTTTTISTSTDIDALTNAIFVQAIVLASWFYSRKKDSN